MQVKVLVLVLLVCGVCGYELIQASTETLTISQAIIDVITKSFLKDITIINIIFSSEEKNKRIVIEKIVSDVSRNVSSVANLRLCDFDNIHNVEEKRFYNIILISDYESFKKLNRIVENELFDFQGFLLIVMVEKYDNQYKDMRKIFQSLWQRSIINVNILLFAVDGSLEMFTFYPYTSVYCGRVLPILTNKFVNSSFIMTRKYFEDKLKNLYGCPLKVVTFNIAPLMFVEEKKQGKFSVSGIEGELLKGKDIVYILKLEIERLKISSLFSRIQFYPIE